MNTYHSGYGYDLEKVLTSLPIKEIIDKENKSRIIQSLEKGNTVQVTFNRDQKEFKMFIEANPQFKSMNVYDNTMKKVYLESPKKEVPSGPSIKQEPSSKAKLAEDDDGWPAKKSKKRKRIGM